MPFLWLNVSILTPDDGDAELDFVVQGADAVYPIETKAGINTKAKSLRFHRETFKPSKSYGTSLLKWHSDAEPEEVPLYAVSSIAHEIEDGSNVIFDQL